VGTERQVDRPEAVGKQAVDGEVAAEHLVAAERDVLVEQCVDLPLEHVARQAIGGNAREQHAARLVGGLEHRDLVALERKVVGRRQTARSRATTARRVAPEPLVGSRLGL